MDQQPQQPPEGGFQVDPARAFQALQRNTADQFARMAGDMAAKDAAIEQLMEENKHLRESVEALTDVVNGTPQTQEGPGGLALVPPPPVDPAAVASRPHPQIVQEPPAAGPAPEPLPAAAVTQTAPQPPQGGVQPIPSGEHVPEPSIIMGPPPGEVIEVGR